MEKPEVNVSINLRYSRPFEGCLKLRQVPLFRPSSNFAIPAAWIKEPAMNTLTDVCYVVYQLKLLSSLLF